MNRVDSLRDIVPTLIRSGLPADYAERAAAELADHHRDLVDELMATGVSESQASTEASLRLGDSSTLVGHTVCAYQRRYWCARWPLITFLIAPLPVLLATWIATAWSLTMAIGFYVQWSGIETVGSEPVHQFGPVWTKYVVLISTFVLAPATVTWFFSKLAKRAALGWPWLILVACIIGLAAGSFRIDRAGYGTKNIAYDRPGHPLERQPSFFIDNPMLQSAITATGRHRWYAGNLSQTCQLLFPLAVGGLFLLRSRQLSRRAELRSISREIGPEVEYEHAKCA